MSVCSRRSWPVSANDSTGISLIISTTTVNNSLNALALRSHGLHQISSLFLNQQKNRQAQSSLINSSPSHASTLGIWCSMI